MSFVRELIQFFAWNPQVPECALFEQREMVSLQSISHYQRVQSYYLSVLLYWNRDQCLSITDTRYADTGTCTAIR